MNKPYENTYESITKILIQVAQEVMVDHVCRMVEALAEIVENLEEENTHETETKSE